MGCGVEQIQQQALGQLLGGTGYDWGSLETRPNQQIQWESKCKYNGNVNVNTVGKYVLGMKKYGKFCWHLGNF